MLKKIKYIVIISAIILLSFGLGYKFNSVQSSNTDSIAISNLIFNLKEGVKIDYSTTNVILYSESGSYTVSDISYQDGDISLVDSVWVEDLYVEEATFSTEMSINSKDMLIVDTMNDDYKLQYIYVNYDDSRMISAIVSILDEELFEEDKETLYDVFSKIEINDNWTGEHELEYYSADAYAFIEGFM